MPPARSRLKRGFSLLVDPDVQLEFLLPNGLILSLSLESDLRLDAVKRQLWLAASKEPLFHTLLSKDCYVFTGIHRDTAEVEEYYDQKLRLRELPLLLPYLRVVEATGDSVLLERNKQDATISSCIGIGHADLDQAEVSNPEVQWARERLRKLASAHLDYLKCTGSRGLAEYLTAASTRVVSQSLRHTLDGMSCLTITAWILDGQDSKCKERRVSIQVPLESTMKEALDLLLRRQFDLAKSTHRGRRLPNSSAYVLKVCCSQAYLFDPEAKLTSFEYVQQCVEQARHPCLSPVLSDDVCDTLLRSLGDPSDGTRTSVQSTQDVPPSPKRTTSSNRTSNLINQERQDKLKSLERQARGDVVFSADNVSTDLSLKRIRTRQPVDQSGDVDKCVSLWELGAYYLSVKVCTAMFLAQTGLSELTSLTPTTTMSSPRLGSPSAHRVTSAPVNTMNVMHSAYVVRVGLFHGSQTMIECQTTEEKPGNHLKWSKWLNFRISLANIPPAARLCLALIKLEKRGGKTLEFPVGWANLNFFNHRCLMVTGEQTLNLWSASVVQSTEERFNRLNPAGTVLDNPNPEFSLKINIYNPVKSLIELPNPRSYIDISHRHQSTLSSSRVNRPLSASTTTTNPSTNPTSRTTLNKNAGFVNLFFGPGNVEGDIEDTDADDVVASIRSHHRMGRDLPSLFPTGIASAANRRLLIAEPDAAVDVTKLQNLARKDPLYELSEQDELALWVGRHICCDRFPNVLPWLSQAVRWHHREELVEFHQLLHTWPQQLPPRIALQLLGAMSLNVGSASESAVMFSVTGSNPGIGARGGASGIADPFTRDFAVSLLYNLSDAELGDYLLQLVQALKAEAYLDNSLSRFLLYRALLNPLQIGLRFFWHLRSEIHLPGMRLKFGLLLEAFCLGCGSLLTILARQVIALNCLETISARVKEQPSGDEQRIRFHEEVGRAEARRDLQWLPSPMCLDQRLGELVIDKCDVKRSKKRPLWLVWTNSDRLSSHHLTHYQLIFKHGDDLRQDVLTLQLLRVMDRIWKNEGLDMCLVPYGCLATGPEMGIIEAVRNARTVMSIQRDRFRSALQFDSTQLHKWLQQNSLGNSSGSNSSNNADDISPRSQDQVSYERCIQNFTMSCAGYCVATFVLGIRDRHPDNIMVDTSGRLFHIDFGHILDNRKKKWGIVRERVPFVLPKDFIIVIARGNADVVLGSPVTDTGGGGSRDANFQEFTQLCGRAYMLLRRHSDLLLTLFAMMLSSGLPELTSVCDLDYVRQALAIDMDDAGALAFFYSKFNKAYTNAWTTKIDWFGHWMNT